MLQLTSQQARDVNTGFVNWISVVENWFSVLLSFIEFRFQALLNLVIYDFFAGHI